MRLIDNYLSAVADHLPRKSRNDIEAELRSTLYEQLEERSAALKRDLTEQEQADFLRTLGHPLKVAGEYAPQRHLIGPTLFPYYLYILQAIAIGLFVFHVALSVLVGIAGGEWALLLWDTVTRVLGSLLVMGAVVTIVFALLERSGQNIAWAEQWNPLTLRDQNREQAADRGDLITQIAGSFVLLLWWNGVIVLPTHLTWGGADITFARPAALGSLLLPVNVLLVGSLALGSAVLVRGFWGRASIALKVIIEAASAVAVVYWLRLPEIVRFTTAGDVALDRAQAWIVWTVRVVLWIVLATILFDLWKYGRMAIRPARRSADPSTTGGKP